MMSGYRKRETSCVKRWFLVFTPPKRKDFVHSYCAFDSNTCVSGLYCVPVVECVFVLSPTYLLDILTENIPRTRSAVPFTVERNAKN